MSQINEGTDAVDDIKEWDSAFDDFYDDFKDSDEADDLKNKESGDNGEDDKEAADRDGSDNKSGDGEDDSSDKDDQKEDADNGADNGEEPDAHKQAVKDALKEFTSENQAAQAEFTELASEAMAMVFPNGVEDPRVDSDGDKITSPKQVEELVNPKTGELFTPEEARDWYENATKKYENNLAVARQEAVRVASVAANMDKGREAVLKHYGDFIKSNPEIAKKVADAYIRTITIAGEGENAYIIDAPIDILEFYNDVMYPQMELAEKRSEEAAAAKAAEEKKQADIKAGKVAREESRDLKVTAPEDAGKGSDESEWDNAFKDYYGGR